MADIYDFNGKAKKDGEEPILYDFNIIYNDLTSETIQAHYMGVSVDHEDFFLFGREDLPDHKLQPPIIVRASAVRKVVTTPAKEIHK